MLVAKMPCQFSQSIQEKQVTWEKREKMAAEQADLSCTSSQDQTGNKTKLGTFTQNYQRRSSWGGDLYQARTETTWRLAGGMRSERGWPSFPRWQGEWGGISWLQEGLFPEKIKVWNPGCAPRPGAPELRWVAQGESSQERPQGLWPRGRPEIAD